MGAAPGREKAVERRSLRACALTDRSEPQTPGTTAGRMICVCSEDKQETGREGPLAWKRHSLTCSLLPKSGAEQSSPSQGSPGPTPGSVQPRGQVQAQGRAQFCIHTILRLAGRRSQCGRWVSIFNLLSSSAHQSLRLKPKALGQRGWHSPPLTAQGAV